MKKHIDVIERMMFCFATSTVDKIRIQPTLRAAKEALEKQIPKKPYKRKEGKETNYYCSCKHYLGDEAEIQLIAIRPAYCDKCGQALDWSAHPTEKGGGE